MSIETKVEGDPSAIRSAGLWLSGTLADRVEGGAAGLRKAQATASSDWGGYAGEAFGSKISTYEAEAKKVLGHMNKGAAATTTFAESLEGVQSAMARIRETARSAGLTVNSTVIQDSGSYPGLPGALPDGASEADVSNHAQLTAEHEKGKALAEAYDTALAEAQTQIDLLNEAVERFKDAITYVVSGEGSIFSGFLASAAPGVMALGAKELLKSASTWSDELDKMGARNLANPRGFNSNLESYLHQDKLLRDARVSGGRLSGLTKLSKAGGPLLTVAGIGLDIAAGEPVDQAIGSNVGGAVAGTAAGVGTTMLIGATVGSSVPVVGTIVGAIVGAGVGYVISGQLDEHWDDIKGGLGDAVDAGEDIVKGGADIVKGGADIVKGGAGKLKSGIGNLLG